MTITLKADISATMGMMLYPSPPSNFFIIHNPEFERPFILYVDGAEEGHYHTPHQAVEAATAANNVVPIRPDDKPDDDDTVVVSYNDVIITDNDVIFPQENEE